MKNQEPSETFTNPTNKSLKNGNNAENEKIMFPFEKAAMEGKGTPKGLDIADTCAFLALKSLYAMYRKGLIDKVNGKEEKNTIFYNWTKNKSEIEFLKRESIALSKRISLASDEYRKNPSIENADKLYAAFYRLPENWREKV